VSRFERGGIHNINIFELDLAEIYYNLGHIHKAAGHIEKAEAAFHKALNFYDKYAQAVECCDKMAAHTREELKNLDLWENAEEAVTPEQSHLQTTAFSPEEREITLLLIEGDTQRDIARKLKLTAAEVSLHVNTIREKVIIAGNPDSYMPLIIREYKLTRREAHILGCLKKGMPNAEIASELFISEETVRFHIHNLLKKLPVETRQDVAAWVKSYKNICGK